jgi:predicted nucleic acid-binding protein
MSRIKLFLDSSALVAGIASPTGGARALLLLSEVDKITVYLSEQVVAESERAIARKLPKVLGDTRQIILRSKARIVKDPAAAEVKRNLGLIQDPTDVPILLAAMRAQVDFLVTLNRKHFLEDPGVAKRSGLIIGTPGDALVWVRERLRKGGD